MVYEVPPIGLSCIRAPEKGVGHGLPVKAMHLCRRPRAESRETCRISAILPVGGWGRARGASLECRRGRHPVEAA